MIRALALLLALALPARAETPAMLPAADHPDWRAIGRVNLAGYARRQACTGTLVAPDLVLTAAHCVFRPGADAPGPAGEIVFAAGWFRGEAAASARVAAIRVPLGWTPAPRATPATAASDIALLTLAEPLSGIPPLPMGALDPGATLRILGYRGDRPHALTVYDDCAPVPGAAPALALGCPVSFGTSGAPVLARTATGWTVVAVTSAVAGGVTLAAPLDPVLP